MNIDLMDEANLLEQTQFDLLHEVLQFAATREDVSDTAELSINIVNNDEIQALNKQYRQKDQPTDVLSFPLHDFEAIEGMPIILGDIIISFDKVIQQAEQYNHSVERELCFLAVHGLLHLLGYTHDTESDEKAMFSKQEAILQEYGLER